MTSIELAGAASAPGILHADALHIPANGPSSLRAWHDVFPIGAERFVVSIGNVAGEAGEVAAIEQLVRRQFDGTLGGTAAARLQRAADALFGRAPGSARPAASAIVGIIDEGARTFTYFSAGQPPPFLRDHGGDLAPLPVDVACAPDDALEHPPAQVVVDLRDTAVLLLYSNALVRTSADQDGGLQRLQHALAEERLTERDSIARLAHELLADRAHDDVAVLALRFPPGRAPSAAAAAGAEAWPRWTVMWSFDATPAAANGARRAFLACLTSKAHGGRTIDLGAAELIYGELLGNVVRHAPGLVEISLDWTADLPVLHVRDNGPGFRSRRARERLPVDDLSESGRGLFIINALAAKFSVHNANGRGTHASATLPLA